MSDPAQIIELIRHVLIKHMDTPEAIDEFRIQRVITLGKNSGRMLSDEDVISGHDVPGGLQLLMRSGDEYTLTIGRNESEGDDE